MIVPFLLLSKEKVLHLWRCYTPFNAEMDVNSGYGDTITLCRRFSYLSFVKNSSGDDLLA
jgi:hypothetical protein